MSTPPPHDSPRTTPPAPAGAPSLVAAGGLPFLITGLIGRLPAATVQLGVLLYVSGASPRPRPVSYTHLRAHETLS